MGIIKGHQMRQLQREIVADSGLDPEFLLICEEAVAENPGDTVALDYLRTVNAVFIAYGAFGEEFLRVLDVDARSIVQ